MKLNLGCGHHKLEGFVNVDSAPHCEPDRLVDLERLPWPFADDSADEAMLRHVLEHLGQDPAVYLGVMRELYRVCRDGATVTIVVPHPRHDSFLNDPTHVRPVTPAGLEMFSKARNREWIAAGLANTPLALQLDVDFELAKVTMHPDEPWAGQLRERRITNADLHQAMRLYNNVIREIEIVLRVRKGDAG